jgi:hypothetical protein
MSKTSNNLSIIPDMSAQWIGKQLKNVERFYSGSQKGTKRDRLFTRLSNCNLIHPVRWEGQVVTGPEYPVPSQLGLFDS